MAEADKRNGQGGAEEPEEAMGEAAGDTLKAPAEVEGEPADKDLPEGTESP